MTSGKGPRRPKRGWVKRERPLTEGEVRSIIGGVLGRPLADSEIARYQPLGYLRVIRGPLRQCAIELIAEGEAPRYWETRVRWRETARSKVEGIAAAIGTTSEDLTGEVLRCIDYAWETTGQGPEWGEVADAVGVSKDDIGDILRYLRHVERRVYFTREHRSLRTVDPSWKPPSGAPRRSDGAASTEETASAPVP